MICCDRRRSCCSFMPARSTAHEASKPLGRLPIWRSDDIAPAHPSLHSGQVLAKAIHLRQSEKAVIRLYNRRFDAETDR